MSQDETQFRPIVGRTWSLTWMESEREGEVVFLHDGFLVGRTDDCHLQLSEGLVSRLHASFRVTADECFLEDNQSTNGTYVNGQKITSRSLEEGDVIQFDEIRFEVTQADARSRPKGRDRRPVAPGRAAVPTRLSERQPSPPGPADERVAAADPAVDDDPPHERNTPQPREVHTDEAQREQIRAERAARKAQRAGGSPPPPAQPPAREYEPEPAAPSPEPSSPESSSSESSSLLDELAEEFAAIPEAEDEPDEDEDEVAPVPAGGQHNRLIIVAVAAVVVVSVSLASYFLIPRDLLPDLGISNQNFVVNQSWVTQPKNGSHFYGPTVGNFIGGGEVEVAYADGFSLVLHKGSDGSPVGRVNLPGTPISPPFAIAEDDGSTRLFITTEGGRAQLLQGAGVIVWSTTLHPDVRGAYLPVPYAHTSGRMLLLPTQGQGIVALNQANGGIIFDTTQVGESNITTNIIVDDEVALVFGGGQRGSIFATNISTRIPQRYWEKRLPGGVVPIHLVSHNNNIIAITAEGALSALDSSTGDIRWSSRVAGGVLSNPVLIEDQLFVADLDGSVHRIDLETGTTAASFDFGIMIESPVISHNGKVVLLDTQGQLQVIEPHGAIAVNHLIPGANGHVNAPVIADVNADGVADLLTLSVNGVLARFSLDPP